MLVELEKMFLEVAVIFCGSFSVFEPNKSFFPVVKPFQEKIKYFYLKLVLCVS